MIKAWAWTISSLLLLLGVITLGGGCSEQSGTPGGEVPDGGDAAGQPAEGGGGSGGATAPDGDGDGVPDDEDNCPEQDNPNQADLDGDGEGDVCEYQDGTVGFPFIIPGDPLLPDYRDPRDTNDAPSDVFDQYPGHEQIDESGPEFVYVFKLEQRTELRAYIDAPEPADTDIDLHLLSSLEPLTLIERADRTITTVLEPGIYYFTLDTYVSGGQPQLGPYTFNLALVSWHAGSEQDPLLPGEDPVQALSLPFIYHDSRDTTNATSDALDSYPGYEQVDESGPEFIYQFTVDEAARLAATIAFEEPTGTDVDLHLLSVLEPAALVTRGDTALYALLEPGTYYLIVDTFADAGLPQIGPYDLTLSIRPRSLGTSKYFNEYVLAAVDYLWANYRLLGYDSAVLTHDIPYGNYGTIEASGGAKTMCVAAAMEVILTAMIIWAEDTGSDTVFDFLPIESWETLHSDHIKAHIWVNHSLGTWGTADALVNFGMGETIVFEQLQPGSFINLNRTTGTGHAVVFLSFIDILGQEYDSYHDGVIGFKYFSSQGGYDVGAGGLDYRYAIFDEYGSPPMPGKRDLKVIYSTDQHYLNTGMMYSPDHWTLQYYLSPIGAVPSLFDAQYFNGVTADD